MKYTLIALGVLVVVGGATYALAPRAVLKDYFQTGDVPTQAEFADTIDSALNLQDDGITADSKQQNPTKEYLPGDTSIKSDPIYQAKVLTQTQPEFKLDSAQPVTFRWTPVVPKPQEPVTYRLKIWQLMQGQSGTQAMKSNQPIVTKDVDNVAEATVSGIYTGPCRPPYLCEFIWSVQAVSAVGTKTDASTGSGSATAPAATEIAAPVPTTGSADGTH